MADEQNSGRDILTDEDLDGVLLAGSEALRGTKLVPDNIKGSVWSVLPPDLRGQFTKGTVIPTDYSGVNENVNTGVALARLFVKITT